MSGRIEALSDHDEELFSQGGCWDLAVELEKAGLEFAVIQEFKYEEFSYPHAFAIDTGDVAVDVFGRTALSKMIEKWSKLCGQEVKVLRGPEAKSEVNVKNNPSLQKKAATLIAEHPKFFLGKCPVQAGGGTSFLPERLVMLDCEMTGVDESKYKLLQAAFVKLELDGEQFKEVGEPLVLYFKHEGQPENNFHKKFLSHIFKECNQSELTGPEGQEKLHAWLGDWLGEVMPTGDCVPTDIAFLKQNGVVKRNDIVDDEQVPGTFHYEYWEMNPLKDISRHIKGEKYAVADLDEEGIHDGLVDCRNQTKELNAALAILLGGRQVPAEVSAVLVMAGEVLTPEEAKKSYDSQESVAERGLGQFENFEWKHAKAFPLDQLSVNGGEPISKPMWTEGYNKPSMPWDSERDAKISNIKPRERTPEDDEFRESWRDESVAEQYAKLTTKAPPIFIIWDEGQHRFRFWNGRHRSRAAWLRGERTIDAIVGQPRPIKEMFSQAEWDQIHASEESEAASDDWKKEGIIFEHEDARIDDVKPAALGVEVYAYKNGKAIGSASFIYLDNPKALGTNHVEVDRAWQRKGIATAMYSYIEKATGLKIKVNDVQTPEGKSIWDQPDRPFGVGAKIVSNKKRIRSADEVLPEDLPVAVQPTEGDDGALPLEKKEVVESYQKKSLRCDSFQDFQELLNQVMLAAELVEDFRPSVAGILNEHRIAEGYVAL